MPEADPQFAGPEEAPRPNALFETAIPASLAVAVLSLLLFAWLGSEMQQGDTQGFDGSVRSWVHQFASPSLTQAMKVISKLGYGILIIELAAALGVFLWLRWRRAVAWLAVAMAGALLLDLTLKLVYHRARPVPFFGAAPSSYSFPSGHALCSFCFYGVLAGLLSARTRSLPLRLVIWIAAAGLIIAIGVSRIYLGFHYPSDVIAGYLAAAIWVSTIIVLDHVRKVRASQQTTGTDSYH